MTQHIHPDYWSKDPVSTREDPDTLTMLEMFRHRFRDGGSEGGKIHIEVAKFHFLNKLIKVLSPKYLGAWVMEKVKGRVTGFLFSWMVWFPDDIKIQDAHQMRKKQDPKSPMDKILPPPSSWPKNSICNADKEMSKSLPRLLKNKHPEDLPTANRLIENLVKEEQGKSEAVFK